MRAGRLGMIALLLSFPAVAQTPSPEPPREETLVVCEAFGRMDGWFKTRNANTGDSM
jgi:hypothetical protein